ncbi:DUF6291 domain-containing protein [Flavobacterium sp. UMI-01]|uniref:DUF6291 domain-containing protein n=1 Tax=Flavobacterium sp. UMI-01 TaxID=1441053 RepID=UPI001C7D0100|nr:DUF6291 domain-containing protein [Flavobacterium sp. UMI-01]GIZ08347.1 hypothetical protein FUMI01_10740 [Flavobacterium sp. UMI-01]
MAEDKKSFVLYTDLLKVVDHLPDEIAGKLFKIILKYVNDVEVDIEDLLLKIAFEPIRLQLQRNLAKWDVIKEKRSLAGKKSAEIKKQNATKSTHVESVEQTATKSTVNVNDNVSVNVNVNGNVINKERENKRFSPPSLLEVQTFIVEKKYGVNATSFWNFYESKNWMVGKNKMKDWKKAVGGWESREKDNSKNKIQNGQQNSNPTKTAYEFSVDRVIETYSSDTE